MWCNTRNVDIYVNTSLLDFTDGEIYFNPEEYKEEIEEDAK